jgi:hypothetical protein
MPRARERATKSVARPTETNKPAATGSQDRNIGPVDSNQRKE